jgi:hypothetical protein
MKDVIAEVVRERLSDVFIAKLLDGAIIFETETTYDRLNFFCFNNIFAVIDIMEQGSLELHIRKICAVKTKGAYGGLPEKSWAILSENNRKIKSFRLACSMENAPASVNEALRRDAENFITRHSALKTDRANPDTEFWFLYRREGFSVFMKRLTRSREKSLHPGELSPSLAWLLCKTGALGPGEIVIDPFCGYGAIPEAAVRHFPVRKFIATDTDPRCVKITRSRRSLQNARCEIHRADVFAVSEFISGGRIDAGSIDAIVTDPPWGMYRELNAAPEEFYGKMTAVFSRLLKPRGRAVILTAAGQALESAVSKTPSFIISGAIPVLVAGKKAAVYRLKKPA